MFPTDCKLGFDLGADEPLTSRLIGCDARVVSDQTGLVFLLTRIATSRPMSRVMNIQDYSSWGTRVENRNVVITGSISTPRRTENSSEHAQ